MEEEVEMQRVPNDVSDRERLLATECKVENKEVAQSHKKGKCRCGAPLRIIAAVLVIASFSNQPQTNAYSVRLCTRVAAVGPPNIGTGAAH